MAKKATDTVSYRSILTDISRKKFASVYILMGEEPYYLDSLTETLEREVIDEADKDFNCRIFYGADADISAVVASCRQLPVMSPKQLVVLKESQSLQNAKMQLEKLAPYVENPNPQTVFVVVYKGEALKSTSKLIKGATVGGGVVFKSNLVRDYQLAGPVRDYCASKKVSIDEKAVTLLCEYIGNPLSKLFGEIDKLIVSTGGSARITSEDIEKNIGISKDFNNFELVKAIANRNYPMAMRIVEYFQNNPKQNPVVVTVATLYKFFSQITEVLFMSDRTDNAMMRALDVKSVYALTDIKAGLRMYNARQAVNIIHALRDLDCRVKGIDSFQNEHELLKEMIFTIFTTR